MASITEQEQALALRLLSLVLLLGAVMCAVSLAIPGSEGVPHPWVIEVGGPVCLIGGIVLLRAPPSPGLLHGALVVGLAFGAATFAGTGGASSSGRFVLPLLVAFCAAFLSVRATLIYVAIIAGIHALPLVYDAHPPPTFSGELAVAIAGYVLLAVGGLRTTRIRYGLWARAESLASRHASLERVATLAVAGGATPAFYGVVAEETGRLLGATATGLVRYDGDEAEVLGSWGPSGSATTSPPARSAGG